MPHRMPHLRINPRRYPTWRNSSRARMALHQRPFPLGEMMERSESCHHAPVAGRAAAVFDVGQLGAAHRRPPDRSEAEQDHDAALRHGDPRQPPRGFPRYRKRGPGRSIISPPASGHRVGDAERYAEYRSENEDRRCQRALHTAQCGAHITERERPILRQFPYFRRIGCRISDVRSSSMKWFYKTNSQNAMSTP